MEKEKQIETGSDRIAQKSTSYYSVMLSDKHYINDTVIIMYYLSGR